MAFPKKRLMGNRDQELIESRRVQFRHFLRTCASSHRIRCTESFRNFIGEVHRKLRVQYRNPELRRHNGTEHIQCAPVPPPSILAPFGPFSPSPPL
jgi:hypothetical protein